MIKRSLVRGAGVFVAWLIGPFGLCVGLANAGVFPAIGALMVLGPLINPYESFRRASGSSAVPFLSPRTALVFAVAEWTIVTIAFAFLTRRLRLRHQLWLAPLVILGIGVGVIGLAAVFGVGVRPLP